MISDLQYSNLCQTRRHLQMVSKDLRGAIKCLQAVGGMEATIEEIQKTVCDIDSAIDLLNKQLSN